MLEELFNKLGFNKEETEIIIHVLKTNRCDERKVYTNLIELFDLLENYGFKLDDILNIIKKTPLLLGTSVNNTKEKILNLIDNGYEKKEIIKMSKISPKILSYNKEKVNKLINLLSEIGYSKDDIIKMSKGKIESYN